MQIDNIYLLIVFSSFMKSRANVYINRLPNIVMIIADDLGIGDLGCFGNDTIRTPNIDKLASEGAKLNHHLSAAGLCTPSRAALLTGRYPARYGMEGEPDTPPVIAHVASRVGLPASETTVAEALSAAGYSTAIVGKWHLGSGCGLFGRNCRGPLMHGFDSFYGMLFTLTDGIQGDRPFWIFNLEENFYQVLTFTVVFAMLSNLYLWKRNLVCLAIILSLVSVILLPTTWFMFTHYRLHTKNWWMVSDWMNKNFNSIVMRNNSIAHQSLPFDSVFDEFMNESISFIHSSAKDSRPFFLFHSFVHVHTPLFASPEFSGRSLHGRYGDNVEEMDHGVGLILEALRKENLDENTIVYFASDHGGHLEIYDPRDGQRIGGHNKRFKGGKCMGAPEGAIRVPGIFRWTGVIPSGSSVDIPTSLLDILPTFLELANVSDVSLEKDLDGVSFASLLKGLPPVDDLNKRVLLHHCGAHIHGLRLITGDKIYKMYLYLHQWEPNSTQCGWKIEFACCSCFDDVIDVSDSPILYELNSDPYEDMPLDADSKEYNSVVAELLSYLSSWNEKVPYPASQYSSKWNTVLSPWLQPTILYGDFH